MISIFRTFYFSSLPINSLPFSSLCTSFKPVNKRKVMKTAKILILFIALSFYGIQVQAQTAHESIPDNLLSEFQKKTLLWQQAYNSGDAQNLAPLYAEDARYISAHVPGLEANGRDKLIANFQNGITGGGHIDSLEILEADTSGHMATLLCKYVATNSGETVSGRNLLVLKNVNGKWLILLHMTVV
jgi:ketosteroid isomerase-like protein